jgi:hypothetical protein
MPTPWIAIGNLVLRNLDAILGVVTPAFTRKRADQASHQAELLSQQIAELQAASSSNTERIKELAEQLKQVVTTLEQAALEVAAERQRTRLLCLTAIALSAISIVAALFFWLSP